MSFETLPSVQSRTEFRELVKSMRILLIGPPGVGKGTQAALLHEKTGAVPLASGDIFRAEIKNQTELGQLAKSYSDRGELVPDEVTIRMMEAKLQCPTIRECGFILDGFPRTVPQAEALAQLLERMELPLGAVIALDIDDEIVVERLGGRRTCPNCGEIFHVQYRSPKVENVCDNCGSELVVRTDDRPETIRERLRIFHENTEPVEAWYQNKGLLRRIDGSASRDEVFRSILDAL
jgi:adenylate kinase